MSDDERISKLKRNIHWLQVEADAREARVRFYGGISTYADLMATKRGLEQELEVLQQNQGPAPGLLLQAILTFGDANSEGRLVEAVSISWFAILQRFQRDPDQVYSLDWRQWEELVAGAYREAGASEVILTPRSGDGGRDVVATFKGVVGSLRFVDQVKAYRPGHRVRADDVRALAGVLLLEPGITKGFVTTTSDFAPGVRQDPRLATLMPTRLELRDRQQTIDWLSQIDSKKTPIAS